MGLSRKIREFPGIAGEEPVCFHADRTAFEKSTFNRRLKEMLGEQISETNGKRIVRRVLSSDPLTVEVTFEDSGKMLGIDVNGFGTYKSQVRADGTIYGEGEGAYMTRDGEVLPWKGSGLGQFKEGGAVSYRGIVYYRTTSQKLARLNVVGGVFEFEVAANGDMQLKVWEWK
jgi:hypothetical protein